MSKRTEPGVKRITFSLNLQNPRKADDEDDLLTAAQVNTVIQATL